MNATAEIKPETPLQTISDALPFNVRAYKNDDWPHIISSWVQSLARESRHARHNREWKKFRQLFIEDIRDRAATFMVAVSEEDTDHILGWACGEAPNILHYVHVKRFYREQGVAKRLIANMSLSPQQRIFCTNWTRLATKAFHNNPLMVRIRA